MDNPPSQPAATRRAFCRSLARYTALAGLLGVTGVAVLHRPAASAACPRASLCQGCPTSATCTLPEKRDIPPTPQSDP